MTVAAQMLDTYPKDLGGVDEEKLRACIEGPLPADRPMAPAVGADAHYPSRPLPAVEDLSSHKPPRSHHGV
jgi:hypothetical protein